MKKISFALMMIVAGCAGPNPVQVRVSLFTVYSPHIYAATCGPTNAAAQAAAAAARGSSDNNALTWTPSQRGVCVLSDNMFAFPNGSGTAASNETLSHITFTPNP